jgi:hypothetical protein
MRISDMNIMDIRGIRNHNPGNIRHGADWQGLAGKQTDVSFCQFVSPEWGIRAMARILNNYYNKRGLHTVAEIIFRWAPPEDDNDSWAYANSVSKHVGIPKAIIFSEKTFKSILSKLITAIIKHENGINPYSEELIKKGIDLA